MSADSVPAVGRSTTIVDDDHRSVVVDGYAPVEQPVKFMTAFGVTSVTNTGPALQYVPV